MSLRADLVAPIREAARALGFAGIGFAAAGHADPEGRFAQWLADGNHADLDFLARHAELRRDPRLFVPGLQTVISVSMLYRHAAPPAGPEPGPRGQISCYAWGADYHQVVLKKLRRLRQEIERLAPGAKLYNEVDTGPVLEKVWAQRAGLGWIGRHSNLLTRQGSWFFLGTILTDLALPPDPPTEDFCGSCTKCMDACPTQAIIAPAVVDARRCISYLTIENQGGIPRALRPHMKDWIFGCDDCQTVCPWQKFDPGSTEEKFRPRPGLAAPLLLDIIALDEAGFTQRFQGTPVARAGRRGMRRNALVALGNQGDAGAVPALAAVLSSAPDPMLRGHAAWALGRLRAVEVLRAASLHEEDPSVLEELGAALLDAAR